jgi:DNA polymerase-3 subunit epsilon
MVRVWAEDSGSISNMNRGSEISRSLAITRPIVFLDLETTGRVLGLDRIVELGVLRVTPDGNEIGFASRVNPEMSIPKEATTVHGISNEDVRKEPKFAEIAPRISRLLAGADLAGYNILSFDLPMLQSEFDRVGISLSLKGRNIVDVMKVFFEKEPRDLSAAYRFYCGKEMRESHSAAGDARATLDVLRGQLRKYPDLPNTPKGISAFLAARAKTKTLDESGWFETRDGEPAFARGKYRGILIREVWESDPDYMQWLSDTDIKNDTLKVIRTVVSDFGK